MSVKVKDFKCHEFLDPTTFWRAATRAPMGETLSKDVRLDTLEDDSCVATQKKQKNMGQAYLSILIPHAFHWITCSTLLQTPDLGHGIFQDFVEVHLGCFWSVNWLMVKQEVAHHLSKCRSSDQILPVKIGWNPGVGPHPLLTITMIVCSNVLP